MFFAVSLALSAVSSDSFLSTNPSPLHSGHIPEPPQSSHVLRGISVSSEPFVLLTSKVAAAPTTVAAIATEAAVSGKAEDTVGNFLSCSCDFMSIEEKALPCNPVQTLSFKSLVTSQHQGKDQPEQPPSHNSVF